MSILWALHVYTVFVRSNPPQSHLLLEAPTQATEIHFNKGVHLSYLDWREIWAVAVFHRIVSWSSGKVKGSKVRIFFFFCEKNVKEKVYFILNFSTHWIVDISGSGVCVYLLHDLGGFCVIGAETYLRLRSMPAFLLFDPVTLQASRNTHKWNGLPWVKSRTISPPLFIFYFWCVPEKLGMLYASGTQ